MRIGLAQIDPTVGDLAGNTARILAAAREAAAQGAQLLVTPELALTGYPPEDLLLREHFLDACEARLAQLARETPLPLLVGHPHRQGAVLFNAASLLEGGRVQATAHKRHLPNAEVFDEKRYFAAGRGATVVEVAGERIGIAICEDIWQPDVAADLRLAGARRVVVLNASPYHLDKPRQRTEVLRQRASETGLPLVYVNAVGGQDELVFDGGSLVMAADGSVLHRLPACAEAVVVIDPDQPGDAPGVASVEEQVWQVLVLAVRDYVRKCGFPGVLLGLSGGIDSAVTLAVAVDALGAERVEAVMMPSRYTADISVIDSRDMVARLDVAYQEIAIGDITAQFEQALATAFAGTPPDTTEENLQARSRGTLLMALSNKSGRLVLTTGNKSEMAVGYATLYGDMAGGYAVLRDVAKTLVYRLAEWRNRQSEVIPERIITRPPSAELRPDQRDQDSLPPYEVLDAVMALYVEQNQSPDAIVAAGYAQADVERVVRLIRLNEYKRRQAAVGPRVTPRGFGKDWRYPIAARYGN
jgi:NAD+ synthase (glutamine-hydrolysing)